MNSPKKLSSHILIVAIALVSMATLMIVANPNLRNSKIQQDKKPVTVVPKVISKVKDLEVISTSLKAEGEPGAALVIEIRNNSDRPIIAITIESGDEKDASGVSTDGFKGGDEPPTVILAPHSTIKMEMGVDNLLPNKPLKVAGVMYLDGSDDGEEVAKKTLRAQRLKTMFPQLIKSSN